MENYIKKSIQITRENEDSINVFTSDNETIFFEIDTNSESENLVYFEKKQIKELINFLTYLIN